MEFYRTLCFKTKQIAEKNKTEIEDYFNDKIVSTQVQQGTDERGNEGYYVSYTIRETLNL